MKNKKGISLITLVITIVVVIILAAAVILSLGNNNPINSARVANVTENKDSIESAILTYTGGVQAKTLGALSTEEILTGDDYGIVGDATTTNDDGETIYNIDKEKFEEKIDTLPIAPTSTGAWYVDVKGHVYLVYEKTEDIPSFMKSKENKIDDVSLNSFVVISDDKGNLTGVSAKTVAEQPNEYYGAEVTNYSANGIEDWKIFHSDGENIYLITSEYIDVDKLPQTPNGNTLEDTLGTFAKAAALTNAISDSSYSTGSESIAINNPSRKWLASYLENYTSSDENMRAVAYMLDTTVWNVYKNSIAEYAIGGPTIEMLFDSYNNKNNVDYQAKAVSEIGYEISKDGGENWEYFYSSMLNTSDTLYVLPSSSGAAAMWLSSPASRGVESDPKGIFYLKEDGGVTSMSYVVSYVGFRPIVCLKSDVLVTKNDDGSVTLK